MKPYTLTGKFALALILTAAAITGCKNKDADVVPRDNSAPPAPAATTPAPAPDANQSAPAPEPSTQPAPAPAPTR
ncbi:hypothetical protein [Duganella violaceipulchra]|uniref:Endopeptidase n=1 Tax=Duganella violaceipulchra TaxID=2849652 RepID=A0AA41L0S5_9BURK|nr:hypothetical protein [Duganella violaceicalia]MBV6319393.1 hypothetical protein [Duganella violaceicalia]